MTTPKKSSAASRTLNLFEDERHVSRRIRILGEGGRVIADVELANVDEDDLDRAARTKPARKGAR